MKIARTQMAIGTSSFSSRRFSVLRCMNHSSTRVDLVAAMASTMRMPMRPTFRPAVVTVMSRQDDAGASQMPMYRS